MPPKPSRTVQPQSRYRRRARDDEAIAAHSRASKHYNRRLADAEFGPEHRARFLRVLEEVADVKVAAQRIWMTHDQVYGRARWDRAFRQAMEHILAERCLAKLTGQCGSASGYKARGRCLECRTAHRRPVHSMGRLKVRGGPSLRYAAQIGDQVQAD